MIQIFLIAISVIWLIVASITDIKKREVADWLSFSLIAIGLFIAVLSGIIQNNYTNLISTLIVFLIFMLLANIIYYSGLFGGGDAKLFIALGAILPQLSFNSIIALPSSLIFLLNTIFIGALYGLICSFYLAIKHKEQFKKEVDKLLKFSPILYILISISIILFILSFILKPSYLFFMPAVLILISPFILIFAKAIENAALVKIIDTKNLTEGDLLAFPIKIGNRLINARLGLTKDNIEFIQKHKRNIMIKEGIAFVPVFLIAFILSLLIGNLFEIFFIFN